MSQDKSFQGCLEASWCTFCQGLFYDFHLEKEILWNGEAALFEYRPDIGKYT